jgi:hypothetical protein
MVRKTSACGISFKRLADSELAVETFYFIRQKSRNSFGYSGVDVYFLAGGIVAYGKEEAAGARCDFDTTPSTHGGKSCADESGRYFCDGRMFVHHITNEYGKWYEGGVVATISFAAARSFFGHTCIVAHSCR